MQSVVITGAPVAPIIAPPVAPAPMAQVDVAEMERRRRRRRYFGFTRCRN